MNERDYILFGVICFILSIIVFSIGSFMLQILGFFTLLNFLTLLIISLCLLIVGFYFHYKRQKYICEMLELLKERVNNGKGNNDKMS